MNKNIIGLAVLTAVLSVSSNVSATTGFVDFNNFNNAPTGQLPTQDSEFKWGSWTVFGTGGVGGTAYVEPGNSATISRVDLQTFSFDYAYFSRIDGTKTGTVTVEGYLGTSLVKTINFSVGDVWSQYQVGGVPSLITGVNSLKFTGLNWRMDNFMDSTAPIPEPTAMIAGALLLLPFGVSTLRMLRRKQS
jgi:hypothetical protein